MKKQPKVEYICLIKATHIHIHSISNVNIASFFCWYSSFIIGRNYTNIFYAGDENKLVFCGQMLMQVKLRWWV